MGPWNFLDMCYVIILIINFFVHIEYTDHKELVPVITFTVVLFMTLLKSMFYLQTFDSVSILVNLVTQVIYDLRLFMIFFFLLIFMFALIMGTLGVGNLDLKGTSDIVAKGKGSKKKQVDLDNYFFI